MASDLDSDDVALAGPLLPPFHANLRKRLVKTPKLHFYDTARKVASQRQRRGPSEGSSAVEAGGISVRRILCGGGSVRCQTMLGFGMARWSRACCAASVTVLRMAAKSC